MGYQEVFIKGITNRDTERIYEGMKKLGIRSQDDMFAKVLGMTVVKKDIKNLKEGTKLILIVGDRMHSVSEYVDATNSGYSVLDKITIAGAKLYPIDSLLSSAGPEKYNEYFEDSSNDNQDKPNNVKKALEIYEKLKESQMDPPSEELEL